MVPSSPSCGSDSGLTSDPDTIGPVSSPYQTFKLDIVNFESVVRTVNWTFGIRVLCETPVTTTTRTWGYHLIRVITLSSVLIFYSIFKIIFGNTGLIFNFLFPFFQNLHSKPKLWFNQLLPNGTVKSKLRQWQWSHFRPRYHRYS